MRSAQFDRRDFAVEEHFYGPPQGFWLASGSADYSTDSKALLRHCSVQCQQLSFDVVRHPVMELAEELAIQGARLVTPMMEFRGHCAAVLAWLALDFAASN